MQFVQFVQFVRRRRLRWRLRGMQLMGEHGLAPGVGIAWRPETAWVASQRAQLAMTEVIAERVMRTMQVPLGLAPLIRRGVPIVPHGISLSLGGADRPDPERLDALSRVAELLGAPLVSEHICFVRADGVDVGHLTALPWTEEMLAVAIENVRIAQEALPVPLALENIASLFLWPDAEMTEVEFITRLLRETGAQLLLDVSNLYANARNHGTDAYAYIDALPLDQVAYVHVAGGVESAGLYHDTHAHLVDEGSHRLLEYVVASGYGGPVILERDDSFPDAIELHRELDVLEGILEEGSLIQTPVVAAHG